MIPSDEDFHMQEVQRRHYLHMLANEKVRLNDTIGRNNHLKNEINIMRKEILYLKFIKLTHPILDLPKTVSRK